MFYVIGTLTAQTYVNDFVSWETCKSGMQIRVLKKGANKPRLKELSSLFKQTEWIKTYPVYRENNLVRKITGKHKGQKSTVVVWATNELIFCPISTYTVSPVYTCLQNKIDWETVRTLPTEDEGGSIYQEQKSKDLMVKNALKTCLWC